MCVRKGEGLNLKRANPGNSHSESNTGADLPGRRYLKRYLKKRSTWQTSEDMELPGRSVMSYVCGWHI